MKRFLLLAVFLSFGAQAIEPWDVRVSVQPTPGANAYATANGKTVEYYVNTAVAAINQRYAEQGIGVRIVPHTQTPNGSMPADSGGMMPYINYARSDIPSLKTRAQWEGAITIVVANPGAGVPGLIPAVPPASAKDAYAAVNVNTADFETQLEDAISRNIGAEATQGVAYRDRRYPSDGGPQCFHTRDSAPSNPNALIPYAPFWRTSNSPYTDAPASLPSCVLMQGLLGGPSAYWHTAESTTYPGGAQFCTIYTNTGNSIYNTAQFYYTPGPATVACSVDTKLALYSDPSKSHGGLPLGDATHNNVAKMNQRREMMVYFPSQGKNIYGQAVTATTWSARLENWLLGLL